jgi:hypothetical protein
MTRLRSLVTRIDQWVCAQLPGGHTYTWTHGVLQGRTRPCCVHCHHVLPRGTHQPLEPVPAAVRRHYFQSRKENT